MKNEEARGWKKRRQIQTGTDLRNMEQPKIEAKNAQVKYELFNPDDFYNTLIDPFHLHVNSLQLTERRLASSIVISNQLIYRMYLQRISCVGLSNIFSHGPIW